LRLYRHFGGIFGAPQPARHLAGRAGAGRHQRERRLAAAHVQLAGRDRQRAARVAVRGDLGQRDLPRTSRLVVAPARAGAKRSDCLTDVVTLGAWGVPLAVIGGALRVSAPFLFVSLGECLTEKSGRVNLGLEGTLVMGAMGGYGVS